MAHLTGHSQGVQFIGVAPPNGGAISVGGPADTNTSTVGTSVIDGTPVRVVVLALAAAAGLTALKVAGFRFNVGVSA